MLQQVLDLDRDVVGHVGMRVVKRFDDAHGVRRTVEEVGIAERDVLRAGRHLRGDIRQHDFRLHDAELAAVDRHDRAMAAEMAAAAARFRVAGRRGCSSPTCNVAYAASGGRPDRSGTRNCRRGSDAAFDGRSAERVRLRDPARRRRDGRARSATAASSNSPPSTSSTPSERSQSALSGAYSPYAHSRADRVDAAASSE